MTSQSRPSHAQTRPTDTADPFPRLVELLLDLLVSDAPGGRGARLVVNRTDRADETDQADRRWEVGAPDDGHQETTGVDVGGSRTAALTVTTAQAAPEVVQALLRRFEPPLSACLELDRRRREVSSQSQSAVSLIEQSAALDLATGVVMASAGCDHASARQAVLEWCRGEGVDIRTAPAEDLLDRMIRNPPRCCPDPAAGS